MQPRRRGRSGAREGAASRLGGQTAPSKTKPGQTKSKQNCLDSLGFIRPYWEKQRFQ
jgi:hypothetical protein